MTKIKSFDQQNLKQLKAAIVAAISNVEEEYDVKIDIGSSRFTSGKATAHMTIFSKNVAIDPHISRIAVILGLPSDAMGREFVDGTRRMKIVDIKTRNSKNPVIVEDLDTRKQYRAPVSFVNKRLQLCGA